MLLGIDPSLTGTGVCILSSTTLMYVSTISSKTKGIPRLLEIETAIQALLKDIDVVCIEGYGFGARGRAVFSLGELGGIIRRQLYLSGIPYYDVPPTVLKKFVTGKGNANKNVVLEQVFRKWGIGSETLKDDNQVDAYGLARLALATIDQTTLTKYEKEAIKGIGPCIQQPLTS